MTIIYICISEIATGNYTEEAPLMSGMTISPTSGLKPRGPHILEVDLGPHRKGSDSSSGVYFEKLNNLKKNPPWPLHLYVFIDLILY